MTENNIYNLMLQIVQENKSLWRIKDKYMTDAADSPACKEFFMKLAKEKETTITELYMLIKSEINK